MAVGDSMSSTRAQDAAAKLTARGYEPARLLRQYQEQGYVIIDGILSEEPSSPLSLEALREKADTVTRLTRDGQWKHRRIVGNAFPPFDKDNRDSWGVQHIMNPQLDALVQPSSSSSTSASPPALSGTFQKFYSSSPLLDIASLLIDAPVEKMQMELFNLLINPESHHFALGWHRDDIRPDVDEQEEQMRLGRPTYGVQFNTALWDDDCLFIVPGSHQRLRTQDEKKANLAKAPAVVEVTDGAPESQRSEGAFDGNWEVDPPGTLRVMLKAGQTAFYSQRILHRASYLPTRKRATLHGCFGDASDEKAGGAERARNVLQHGVEWMRDAEFGASLPDRLQPMWKNLIRMDKAWSSRTLGYSLDND